jgi:hypothetical protein
VSSWAAALQPFSLTTGTEDRTAPRLVVSGVDTIDPAGRWTEMVEGSGRPGVPAMVLAEPIGGRFVDAYQPVPTPGVFTKRYKITDLDDRGEAGGWPVLLQNRTAFTALHAGVFTLGERPSRDAGVAWQAQARTLGGLNPQPFGGATPLEYVDVTYQLADGIWQSVYPVIWGTPFVGNTGTLHVYSVAGSSAPIYGALVRVHGPINYFDLLDVPSGNQMIFDGPGTVPDPAVTAAQWLLIDTKDWIARILDTDTWDLTAGTVASQYLDANHGDEDLLVLNPVPYLSDPYDRRAFVVGTGTGREAGTRLEIQLYRTRTA